nr:hypothetical protein [Endozoicomonas sp.]
PIAEIISNENQGFLSHYLTALLLYASGQMDTLKKIKYWIDNPPQFHEGMVEEMNDVVRLYASDKKHVRFYDMGGVLKENNNRLVLRGADDELISFRLEDIFNQNEMSPLHLYKDAYDLTSILFVEEIISSMGEYFKINVSGVINQARRAELIRRRKVVFNGHVMNSIY